MSLKIILYLFFAIFVISESSFVENLQKCRNKDSQCETNQLQFILRTLGKTGIPELNMPKLDPMKLTDLTVTLLNSLEITLIEGTFSGLKNCIVNEFNCDYGIKRAFLDITCDVSLKGHYKIVSSSPVINNLLGGQSLHGDGNGKVKLEKMHLKFDYLYDIEQRDGEYYIKCAFDKSSYSYDTEKMTFFADNLYLGNEESSEILTGLLNQNWRFIMDTFGKPLMDKAVTITYGIIQNWFDSVPAKHFIDLSSYGIKNIIA